MGKNLVEKILERHLLSGKLTPGEEIGIRIDQTLTQDATGTMAYLQFEAMNIPKVKTELSVSYIDHNTIQIGFENADDHRYLQTVAQKYGIVLSRAGNGICHQVHLERFGKPGKTLIGSDSHTPTGGALGMFAIGAGGLDVAVAMGGGPFYTAWPKVIGVELTGQLRHWVAPKDIILRLLSILTTRGNVACMVEYYGEGVATLPVPARATVTNMGAELGVTTSVFPADQTTREFLAAQGRADHYMPLQADDDARYDRIYKKMHVEKDAAAIANLRTHGKNVFVGPTDDEGRCEVAFDGITIDLSELEPLAAGTPSPDNVRAVADLAGTKVSQVAIGSCTNSSYQDLMLAAHVLKGRTVHPNVELGIAPGSRQVMSMIAANGALADLVAAGARILESGCGPCIGLGFSPAEGTVSLRTFNRNFAGRSGTKGDMVYLVSVETAVAGAVTGEITDPRRLEKLDIRYPLIQPPEQFVQDDGMIQPPAKKADAGKIKVVRGSTIVKPPSGQVTPDPLDGVVLIKVGDKITTDHIMPAGSALKHRSNVPAYAQYVFDCFNEADRPTFAQRALEVKARGRCGVIVAGDSYGQGSSREHAALCPMYLGVGAVIAKAIERIHQANLVNFAILPLTFADGRDYTRIDPGDELVIQGVTAAILSADSVTVRNRTQGFDFECDLSLAPRQRKILATGGLLAYTRVGGQ